MQNILAILLKFLFEKMPILNWVNGHKTMLSRAVGLVGLGLTFVQQNYPELGFIPDINFWFVWLVSQLGLEVGLAHKKVKGEIKGL